LDVREVGGRADFETLAIIADPVMLYAIAKESASR
tara:strand:+ start:305 stop:409 length:105 start_codon:yes stop_codon:yes gene_type:complete